MEFYDNRHHTNETNDPEMIDRLPRWAWDLGLVIYIILLLLAFIFNSLVLFTLCRVRSMRRSVGSTMNIMLGNLALADLLLAISTTLEATAVYRHSWELGSTACKIQRWFMYSFYAVSMLSLIIISLEKYYAICDPLNKKVLQNTGTVYFYKMIGALWVAALLLESPQLLISDLENTYRTTVCTDVNPEDHDLHILVLSIYYLPMFILLYALPVVMFTVTFYKIGRKLRGVEKRLLERSRHDIFDVVQKRKRVLRVLLAVVIIFICCWSPFNFVQLLGKDTSLDNYDPLGNFYVSIKMLALCHAVLSPIIWTFMGQQFRNGVKRALGFAEQRLNPYGLSPGSPGLVTSNVQVRSASGGNLDDLPAEFRPRSRGLEPRDLVKRPSKLDLLLTSITPQTGSQGLTQGVILEVAEEDDVFDS
ncbi:predicted protein [Nematostella vectensis]|uniref:G-protein coupled receptors family 1 profile domain-containing protein n=2 Tax=Nematostella vectensis TaxID=45351 RepID=A7RJ65_NEMVE|nr:predicted protein [Nematostella vectensis]|eukprot:XP_001640588.1 predicted protein [Nematostella vectensis]